MDTLPELLQYRTVRELGTVARRHGLPFNNKHPKAVIYARLVEQLRSSGLLKRAWRMLSGAERDALRSLQAAGGVLDDAQFTAQFGGLRKYRPWSEHGDRLAWKRPASIAEKLWYLGFIERDKTRVMLCSEALAILPPLPRIHPTPAPEPTVNNTSDVLRDVAALLGLVTGQSVKLVYKRFLPPRIFRLLDSRLTRHEPTLLRMCSERQLGYPRWIHYLAECSGLVEASGGRLRLSTWAWEWLALAPETQWRRLMNAVRLDVARRTPLWDTYRLPVVDKTLWVTLESTLARLETGSVYRVRGFLRLLRIHAPTVTGEQVRALLSGPLSWSGRILMSEDQRSFAVLAADQPVLPEPMPAHLHLEPACLTIYLPPLPMLRPLVELCGWATVSEVGLSALHLDRIALERAAKQHLKPLQIAQQLSAITGTGIAPEVYGWLEQQSRQCGQLRIEQLTALRAANPETLRNLFGDRTLRGLLDKPISPHHATVKAGKIEELARTLVRRGLIPDAEAAQQVAPDAPSTQAYAWLAMRVYQELGALFPQIVRLPGAVSDEVKQALSPSQQGDLEAAAQTIIDAVQRAFHGDVSTFAETPVASSDPDTIRAAVEHAYAEQTPLTIDYFSPSHGIPTRRTITPTLPIRWNGTVGYIHALCQLDNDSRTFRLDRILQVYPK